VRSAACLATAVVLVVAGEASAAEQRSVDEEEDLLGDGGNLRTRAETVSFDARERVLELSGDVRIDAPPFHLRSQRIKLSRTRFGIEVEGKGRLAFCPCLGTPLTVDFDKAIVAPPGDLILRSPTLRFYGVPVMYLPWFWMRSDEKLGVLPPDIAYRGQDGMFAGGGVHVPWKTRGEKNALDLRAGAYLFDGFAGEARLRTPVSHTKIRYDRLGGDDGLAVDARGGVTSGELGTSWDVDVLRGERGVRATTDLDAAAKPWDRGSVEGALRAGPFTVATGYRIITRRGGAIPHVQNAGPVTTLRASGALGGHVTYDATVEGGALRISSIAPISPETVSFARAEAGATLAGNVGPVASSVSLRGAGDVVNEGNREGSDRAGLGRARVGIPLVRGYRSAGDGNDPWIHVIEPFVEGGFLHARGNELLGTAPGRGISVIEGTASTTSAGLSTSIGRWASRESLDLVLAGGAAHGSRATASGMQPILRGRASASLAWLGATADAADVEGGDERGHVVVARIRVGPDNGLRVLANVADRAGVDPVLARSLADAPLEPSAGFLSREGTTGGAGLVVPWSGAVTTTAGADVDASGRELVAARGGVEIRDRCRCLTLRVNGSHRIGRSGVDVWVALDFVPR
jgi:hypothetical protein